MYHFLSIRKPGSRLTLSQRHELSDGARLTKWDKRGASRTRKDEDETVLSLRMETSLAVGQIIVPDSHKYIVEPKLTDQRFIGVESATPFGERLGIVQSNVVDVLQSQSRILIGSINKGVERRAARTGENDGVDKIGRSAVSFVPRLGSSNGLHYEDSVRGENLLNRPVELAKMLVADSLNHLTGQDAIEPNKSR